MIGTFVMKELKTSELSDYSFELYIAFNRFHNEHLFPLFKITLLPPKPTSIYS